MNLYAIVWIDETEPRLAFERAENEKAAYVKYFGNDDDYEELIDGKYGFIREVPDVPSEETKAIASALVSETETELEAQARENAQLKEAQLHARINRYFKRVNLGRKPSVNEISRVMLFILYAQYTEEVIKLGGAPSREQVLDRMWNVVKDAWSKGGSEAARAEIERWLPNPENGLIPLKDA